MAKDGQISEPISVAIIGGGPVGLTAALALARRGVDVLLLERESGYCNGSRAICISRRSLQILDRLGVGAPFMQKGLGWSTGTSYLNDKEVFHLDMPMGEDDRFPPFINLQQYYAERFIDEGLSEYDGIDIHRNAEVHAIEDRGDRLCVRWHEAGRGRSAMARWVIACDGAKSTTRQLLGLKMSGEAYDSQYLIADIEIDLPWPTARKVWFDPPSNPGSTVIMHRQPDNVWRLDYQLLSGEDPEMALRKDRVRDRIQCHLSAIGFENTPWTLIWRSLYRAHCLSLADYRHGRIFFAGDAAHLVPIFGVRGMNSGIEDADNLAWKLAMVIAGTAAPSLLDSYSVERRGAYEDNIAAARKSTWFMSPPSAGFAMARDAILELAIHETGLRGLINPRQASVHRYVSSAIPDAPAAGAATPGWPLHDIRAESGTDLHRSLGRDFTGIHVSAEDAPAEWREIGNLDGADLRMIAVPDGGHVAAALSARAGTTLLIRPDDHIAMRGEGLDRSGAMTAVQTAARSILAGSSSNRTAAHG